ncbi:kinesin-like nuclear fusion protein [Ceratocystis pirilliformis]|uniref:Kinesin-like nuclear fusion protein n=1 Tax=Ceratocystis pirilliformis TaxID=259994 RepID=A0ABR3YJK0_9PEZI
MVGLQNSRWAGTEQLQSATVTAKDKKIIVPIRDAISPPLPKVPCANSENAAPVGSTIKLLSSKAVVKPAAMSPALLNSRWASESDQPISTIKAKHDSVPPSMASAPLRFETTQGALSPPDLEPMRRSHSKNASDAKAALKSSTSLASQKAQVAHAPSRSSSPIKSRSVQPVAKIHSRSVSPRKGEAILGGSSTIHPATTTPATTPKASTARENLQRFLRIVARLKWKHPYLQQAYKQAMDALHKEQQQAAASKKDGKTEAGFVSAGGATNWADMVEEEEDENFSAQQHATRQDHHSTKVVEPHPGDMFKLDFFEYYMLLERAVVHILYVFNERIHRSAGTGSLSSPSNNSAPTPGLTSTTLPPPSSGTGTSGTSTGIASSRHAAISNSHSFHQDVLSSLAASPSLAKLLRNSGGTDALVAFQLAKTLRNRWKFADMESQSHGSTKGLGDLASVDFDNMLSTIFAFFDRVYDLVLERNRQVATKRLEKQASENRTIAGDGYDMLMDLDLNDPVGQEGMEAWRFLDSAMDWEAI